jgi:hypothetical protein
VHSGGVDGRQMKNIQYSMLNIQYLTLKTLKADVDSFEY